MIPTSRPFPSFLPRHRSIKQDKGEAGGKGGIVCLWVTMGFWYGLPPPRGVLLLLPTVLLVLLQVVVPAAGGRSRKSVVFDHHQVSKQALSAPSPPLPTTTTTTTTTTTKTEPTPSAQKPPNIILYLTDDQDLLLDSLTALPWTMANLAAKGAFFKNFYAHTPVCCPSRSELLTGRYFHNLRATDAHDSGCMHVNATDDFEKHEVVASTLQARGYKTGMFGKYLNMGGMKHICAPPLGDASLRATSFGWDRFYAMW